MSTLADSYERLINDQQAIVGLRDKLVTELKPYDEAWSRFVADYQKASDMSWGVWKVLGFHEYPARVQGTDYDLELEERTDVTGFCFTGEDWRAQEQRDYVLPFGFITDQAGYTEALTRSWDAQLESYREAEATKAVNKDRRLYEELKARFENA